MRIVSVDEIKNSVTYNRETGRINRIDSGKTLGDTSFLNLNYITIYVNGIKLRGHTVAWVMEHGKYPDDCIDHINGVKSDNRICNLRSVSQAENMKNKKKYKNNSTGVSGVYFEKDREKYRAKIGHGKSAIYVGRFSTLDIASKAIEAARKEHGYLR
jgi:hypothetical protein